MSEELAIKIFKQASLTAEVAGCVQCPRKNEMKHTCISCLDNAKESLLDYIEQLQQENEKLKEEVQYYRNIVSGIENWLTTRYENQQRSIQIMKQKNDPEVDFTKSRMYLVSEILDELTHLKNTSDKPEKRALEILNSLEYYIEDTINSLDNYCRFENRDIDMGMKYGLQEVLIKLRTLKEYMYKNN